MRPQSFEAWHREALAEAGASNRALPRWLSDPALAKSVYADMLPTERASSGEARTIADLTARIAKLENAIRSLPPVLKRIASSRKAGADPTTTDVRLRHLGQRLDEIEKRAPAAVSLPTSADLAQIGRHGPQLFDAGVWNEERSFRAGDVVTCSNAAWVAQIDSRGVRPGAGATWRLLNKSDVGHLKRAVREEVERQMRKEPTCRRSPPRSTSSSR